MGLSGESAEPPLLVQDDKAQNQPKLLSKTE